MTELQLAAECCRAAFGDADTKRICRLGEAADWPRFLRIVRFHRVEGLVSKCLAATDAGQPASVADAIAADATRIAADNLRASVECRELQRGFELDGIDCLFLKGLTLGALAYGTPWIKAAVDIDLLVSPAELMAAAAVLRDAGYELCLPASDLSALPKWHRQHKESAWRHSNGSQIDLHTRLADNPRLIPTMGLSSPRQNVQVAEGVVLPTLAKEELFAYVAVHGASSAWFRLKWITDLAALLHRSPGNEIKRLYRRSQDLGAGRAAAQALLLADALYATVTGVPDLKHELEADRASRWLAHVALRQLSGRDEPVEPTSVRGGTAAIHYSQLMLLPGFGFKMSELLRQARSAFG